MNGHRPILIIPISNGQVPSIASSPSNAFLFMHFRTLCAPWNPRNLFLLNHFRTLFYPEPIRRAHAMEGGATVWFVKGFLFPFKTTRLRGEES